VSSKNSTPWWSTGFVQGSVVVVTLLGFLLAIVFWLFPRSPGASFEADGIVGLSGGCDPYRLYAQNRWLPHGASGRAAPSVTATKVRSFGPNEVVTVDGWVHSEIAYPTNSPPWNSDIWFHLDDGTGWVSFAAVRELPTDQDPTLRDPDGGPTPPAPALCQGAIQ